VASCYNRLGLSYYWDSKYKESIEYHNKAFELRKQLFGEKSEKVDDSRFSLAKAYYYANMENDALECFLASLKFRKKQFGITSKEYNKAKEWVDKIDV